MLTKADEVKTEDDSPAENAATAVSQVEHLEDPSKPFDVRAGSIQTLVEKLIPARIYFKDRSACIIPLE